MTEHRDGGRDRAGEPGGVPDWVDEVRARYNPPPAAPREEMWDVVQRALKDEGRVRDGGAGSGGAGGVAPVQGAGAVVDLEARRRRATGPERRHGAGSRRWAWAAAAAAVLAVGVGIGRWSAPTAVPGGERLAVETTGDRPGNGVELAARLHFGRTESLLTTVRSDARSGRVDDSVGPWARSLLSQTRLLMDARGETRDETQRLLSDLELVLVQILGASETGSMDEDRAREELDLAVRSLDQGELLTRIRSAAPTTMAGA